MDGQDGGAGSTSGYASGQCGSGAQDAGGGARTFLSEITDRLVIFVAAFAVTVW